MQQCNKDIMILKGNIVYTEKSSTFNIIENGYIIVKGKFILGVYKNIPDKFKDIKVKDYKDKIIIPGFVDLHTHASQFEMKGKGYDKTLIDWLDTYIFKEESKFSDLNYAEKTYRDFVNELYEEGTTRAVIFATIHNNSTDILMKLLEEKGIISYVGKVNMDRNCPDTLKENSKESIKNTIEWLKNCQGKYKFVKPIITPRFVPSCTGYLMQELGKIALENNLPVQSHLSENVSEVEWVKKLHPESKNYSDVYNKFNLFGQTKTVMAHCVYLTEDEIEKIKNNKVFIAHCPTSNVNLQSGIAPVKKFLNKDVYVGLGSDIAGGDSLSMLKVISSAVKVSKLREVCLGDKGSSLTLEEAFYLATKGGGRFFGKVGSFEEGYEFDALVINDDNLCRINKGTIKERIERLVYCGNHTNIEERYVGARKI